MTNPFLTVANVRLIEQQVSKILGAKSSSKDPEVLNAVKGLAVAEIEEKLPHATEEILHAVRMISDRTDAELFIESLKRYTIPFKAISEKGLQKLFRKDKKLKLPKLELIDWYSLSYLSWLDSGTHRQYIVIEKDGAFMALRGISQPQYATKGICAICHQHGAVHLFTATVKGSADMYTSYSNYICDDVATCNMHVTDHAALEAFVARNLV